MLRKVFSLTVLCSVFLAFDGVSGTEQSYGPRIVGGEEASIEDFPYQVYLKIFVGNNKMCGCGGSIFKEDAVITAAHCVKSPVNTNSITIFAGTVRRGKWVGATIRYVKSIIIHEKFNATTFHYDLALLILTEPFQYSDKIKPIQLSKSNEMELVGVIANVSGWGRTSELGPIAEILQYTSVQIISNDKCRKAYGDVITKLQICAQSPTTESGRDACEGDSGGPLAYKGKLIGVVSCGTGCARPNMPGIYTRISMLTKWIKMQYSKAKAKSGYN